MFHVKRSWQPRPGLRPRSTASRAYGSGVRVRSSQRPTSSGARVSRETSTLEETEEDIRPRTRRPFVRCPDRGSVGYFALTSPPFDRHARGRAGGRDLRPTRRGIDSLDDPAPRCGRSDGDGLAGTHRRSVPRVGTSQPHLVFVLGVIVTVAVGLEAGLVWAFVGAWSSTSWHNGRSVDRRSRCSSAWAARRARPVCSPASARSSRSSPPSS